MNTPPAPQRTAVTLDRSTPWTPSALDLAWLRVLETLPPARQSDLDAHEAVDGIARPFPHASEPPA